MGSSALSILQIMAIKNTAVTVYAAFGEVDELDDLFVVHPRLILLQ